jgi:Uma2 family endonuclease
MPTHAITEDAPLPNRHRWSRVQYERAIDSGLFDPGDRVELLGGEITDKMSPQNSRHSAAIGAAQYALDPIFKEGYWIRVQLPLAISDDSEPEPDLAVVTGTWRDYRKAQPITAPLVIEIADTTLLVDRLVSRSRPPLPDSAANTASAPDMRSAN